jgi:hypothetical protein
MKALILVVLALALAFWAGSHYKTLGNLVDQFPVRVSVSLSK